MQNLSSKYTYLKNPIRLRFFNSTERKQSLIKAKKWVHSHQHLFSSSESANYRLKILRASTKSQVFEVADGEQCWILKRHRKAVNFNSELAAYLIFSGSEIPKLLGFDIKSKWMLIEYVGKSKQTVSTKRHRHKIASVLGNMFKVGQVNLRHLRRHAAIRNILGLNRETQNHVCIVTDIKPEHFIVDRKRLSYVDLETIRLAPDSLEIVLGLSNFYNSPKAFINDFTAVLFAFSRAARLNKKETDKIRAGVLSHFGKNF